MRTRRIMARVVVCAMLGAVTSVGMALWIAALQGRGVGQRWWIDVLAAPGGVANAVRTRTFGVEIVRIYFGDERLDRGSARRGVWRRGPQDPARELWLTPWWAQFVDRDTKTILPGDNGLATGWPVPCLSTWVKYDHERGEWRVVGGWNTAGAPAAPRTDRALIPLTPVWRGLIVSAAAHGAWWFAIASVMMHVMRHRRVAGRMRGGPTTIRWIAVSALLGSITTLVIAMAPPLIVRTMRSQSGGIQSLLLSRDVDPPPGLNSRNPPNATDSTGFPMRCFFASWWATTPLQNGGGYTVVKIEGGLVLADGGETVRLRVLPLRPQWSGLAFNIVLFSALWMLIVPLVAAAIDLRRRMRGQCPRCAYDLRHDFAAGCPECGWGREVKA